jgi:hypothetical protein
MSSKALKALKLALGVKEAVRQVRIAGKTIDLETGENVEIGGAVAQSLLGLVRHAISAYGVVLVSNGVATENEVAVASGAIVTLIGVALSVGRKWLRSRK